MKESSEFPVEELLWAAILCDCSSNEEKILDYQEKIRLEKAKISGGRNLKNILVILGLSIDE